MTVKFNRFFTDPGNRVYNVGEQVELTDSLARDLVHYGIASPIPVKPVDTAERAVPKKRTKETR
jgi:hypothetical protein